jgi:hypothetical protein
VDKLLHRFNVSCVVSMFETLFLSFSLKSYKKTVIVISQNWKWIGGTEFCQFFNHFTSIQWHKTYLVDTNNTFLVTLLLLATGHTNWSFVPKLLELATETGGTIFDRKINWNFYYPKIKTTHCLSNTSTVVQL